MRIDDIEKNEKSNTPSKKTACGIAICKKSLAVPGSHAERGNQESTILYRYFGDILLTKVSG